MQNELLAAFASYAQFIVQIHLLPLLEYLRLTLG
jgi:hypothetical protein